MTCIRGHMEKYIERATQLPRFPKSGARGADKNA
jgi:hypothetical protein